MIDFSTTLQAFVANRRAIAQRIQTLDMHRRGRLPTHAIAAMLLFASASAWGQGQSSGNAAPQSSVSAEAANSAICFTCGGGTAPTVQLTSPANGATAAAPGSFVMTATASDSDGTITKVQFKLGNTLLGTDTTAPYSYTFSGVAAGTYVLKAVATDNSGATSISEIRTVTVTPAASVTLTRTYVYDSNERLCKTINPESGASIIEYDGAGNILWTAESELLLSAVCDRAVVDEDEKSGRTYDKRNRLLSVTTPEGTANTVTTYHADGLVDTITASNPGGFDIATSYQYNNRRLLTGETSVNGLVVYPLVYRYTSDAKLSTLVYPDKQVIEYNPDALGRARHVIATAADGDTVYASNVLYWPNGAIKSFTYGNGVVHTLVQNTRGLPSESKDSGAAIILHDKYFYDPNGNVDYMTDATPAGADNRSRDLGYDKLDRLLVADAPHQWGAGNYTYDALDNLRTADLGTRKYRYNYDAVKNRLDSIDDPVGARVFTLAHDERGNVTSKNSQVRVFDATNRLSEVTGQQVYRYDGLGRRVQATDAGLEESPTTWVYSQSGQVLYTNDARRKRMLSYIYLGNTQVATRSKTWNVGTVPVTITVSYQHTDALGSPVAESNSVGVVIKQNSYSPYGEAYALTSIDGTGYTGHVMDQATGLAYMQQRYYDPQIGRFLSVDPMDSDMNIGWNFNRYNYAANNPYRFKDPDGRIIETPWDVLNVGMDIVSIGTNVAAGNYGSAAIDVGALIYDGAATLVPGLPGGAGAALKAVRLADKAHDVAKGVANGVRAGKKHTPAANKLGRERNRVANGGELKCPTCNKKMNEPVQSKKGETVDRDAAVGDHVVAKARGGDGATVKDMANHDTKCWDCNSKKSDN